LGFKSVAKRHEEAGIHGANERKSEATPHPPLATLSSSPLLSSPHKGEKQGMLSPSGREIERGLGEGKLYTFSLRKKDRMRAGR